MEETLDFINNLLQQAYFYIPAILGFISAVGFPSLVQIARIVAAVRLYVAKIAVVTTKVNETVSAVNALAEFTVSYMDEDAKFFEDLAETEYNKKRKEAYLKRAEVLRQRKAKAIKHIEAIKEELESAKRKRKVRVRIVKDKQEAATDEEGVR